MMRSTIMKTRQICDDCETSLSEKEKKEFKELDDMFPDNSMATLCFSCLARRTGETKPN